MGNHPWNRVYLVSCVARKRAHSSSAKDLYVSDWFVSARDRIEREEAPWYILSAQYGLVHPDTVIAPYNVTLNTMGVASRRDWAAWVITQMEETLPHADEVVIFAGQRYREFLEDYLRHGFSSVKGADGKAQNGRAIEVAEAWTGLKPRAYSTDA